MRKDLILNQGETYELSIPIYHSNGEPIENVVGYEASSQLRRFYTSNSYHEFTCVVSNGEVILSLTANQSATIESGAYVYDVELTDPDGNVKRIQEGKIEVTPEVTR